MSRSRDAHPFFWSLVIGLAFWAGLSMGCFWINADAQAPVQMSSDSGDAHLPRIEQYHGAVTCFNHEPAIERIENHIVGDSLLRAEVVRHEAMHFVQLAAGNCDSTLAAFQANPVLWLQAEAEASCVGFKVYADPAQRRARQIATLLVLAFRRPAGISFGDVREALEQWCAR